ncbi:MAG: S41 family peptidase [Acidobacteriota bacterium]
MKRNFAILAFVLVVVGALVGGLLGRLPSRGSASSAVTPERIENDYKEAVDLIDKNYVGNVDHEKVSDRSIQGMLWTLDPHSSFFTRDEFRKLNEEQASQFYGIGVSILRHDGPTLGGVYVQSVIPNTPAEKAGLRYGDRILTVDGKDAKDWTVSEVSKNVRGEKNTAVDLAIERAGSNGTTNYEITRGGVPLPSVRNYFMLPNGTGYVGLTGGFQETTAEELDTAIAELKKQGMKNLVLDLRGNPGGLLPQAIEVASRFIPGGQTIVSVKGRSRYAASQDLKASEGKNQDFPLVVMMNSGSASASEIVAGAIQDYGRGLIVGTNSFGKGLVQRIFPLSYGTGLTLTTARYYTPFGRSLQRDYSNGSIYDYYTHGEDVDETLETTPKPTGSPVATANGRVLYGGLGIAPDVTAASVPFTPLRSRIGDAAFFFVRQLAAGRVSSFENYKIDHQNFKATLQADDVPVTDKLFEAFTNFAAANKDLGLTSENVSGHADYAKTRLRGELATANFSNEAGVQALLEKDPQILKALEAMSDAKKLNENLAWNRH